MKNSDSFASVQSNSNKVISSSNSNWSFIRQGSQFQFVKDNVFYIVADVSPFTYIKNFQTLDNKRLKILDKINNKINRGDILNISYNQYEVFHILDIKDGGRGYKLNENIELIGGILSTNKDNLTQPASFIVKEINEFGGISQVGLLNKGLYTETPQNKCEVIGGSGEGAVLELEYHEAGSKVRLERNVFSVDSSNDFDVIILDYPLPSFVNKGSISVDKWEITLTSNYIGEDKINERYEVSRDFTSNLNLPLLLKNSFAVETNFNHAMRILDKEINDLKEEVNRLKSKITS